MRCCRPVLATAQHSLQTLTLERARDVQLVTCDSPVGRLGLSVCYDLRFPAVYQELAFGCGAEVLLVPSAFTVKTGVSPALCVSGALRVPLAPTTLVPLYFTVKRHLPIV